jgi:hypothetical protein
VDRGALGGDNGVGNPVDKSQVIHTGRDNLGFT